MKILKTDEMVSHSKELQNNDKDSSASVFREKIWTLSLSAAGFNEEAPGDIEEDSKSVDILIILSTSVFLQSDSSCKVNYSIAVNPNSKFSNRFP